MPGGKRKPKDDEQSVTSDSKLPVKNVPALMGEGEKFFRDQLYPKAIQCYTEVRIFNCILEKVWRNENKIHFILFQGS
jgi:hypothetical protein